MKRTLSIQERSELKLRHKKERDKRICDRIKAVLAHDDGYSYSEVAKLLLLDDETVRRHIKEYFSNNKLAPENGGSQSYLSHEHAESLATHLEEKTYLQVKQICEYVLAQFDIQYSVSGMRQWLHDQGFCYKKPHGVPAKADAEKQSSFKIFYNNLKSTLAKDEAIFFGDSAHPSHQTRPAYGWIKKGVRKAVKMTASQKRLNLIGAINLSNHKVVVKAVDWVNCDSLKLFCKQLIQATPKIKRVHLILDNAGYHKSKEFTEWIETTKIKLHYLPPYSPNLNPIERLWKVMHENVTYNRYYQKFACFKEATLGFFRDIKKYKAILKTRITDNFQTLVAT
jgi:transposase